ncbi:FAD:protein FMN transferase [Mesonia sp. HuA40]|uniref:FAD:protein FMN transferase n=1 Tax=Mesonia sp. HuA40 TaxID=2602761 RepID=UPI0011CA4D4F|nr:FAD:protein FMN transferase [Mesonia sp. HuA40]TXK73644.1 FAD:protein FMN transferase [Mesonia sp. HuA40]
MRHIYLFLICLFVACQAPQQEEFIISGDAFGTRYYINTQKKSIEKSQIDSIINRVNQSVSTYLETSDISRVNAGDSTIVVDFIFSDVLQLSKTIYKETDGFFDPTVGALRNAYGFGTSPALNDLSQHTIDSLLMLTGLEKISLTKQNQIRKVNPNIYIDFNAIAKGYGIDLIAEFLNKQGIENYLVELGGEIVTRGQNLHKNADWIVGVEGIDSDLENRSYQYKLKLKNEALASSGNYRKFWVDSLSGKKYVHTINPRTGQATTTKVTSASIIATTCAKADAYATSVMAMGKKKTLSFLKEENGIKAAYFTYIDSLGKQREYMTQSFKERLVN